MVAYPEHAAGVQIKGLLKYSHLSLKRAGKYKSIAFTDTCTKKKSPEIGTRIGCPQDGKNPFSPGSRGQAKPECLEKDRAARKTIQGKETVASPTLTPRVISDKSRATLHSDVTGNPSTTIPRKTSPPKAAVNSVRSSGPVDCC